MRKDINVVTNKFEFSKKNALRHKKNFLYNIKN